MTNQQKNARICYRYRVLLTVVFFFIPVVNGLMWGFADSYPTHWAHQFVEIVNGFTPMMKGLAFCASMIKGAIAMYGIWILTQLFKLYEAGIFFKSANVDCFKKLSRTLIGWVIAGLFVTPLLSVILTMNNPPGQHSLQVSFESADITALISGGILHVIAGVMAVGQKLQEEQELTV